MKQLIEILSCPFCGSNNVKLNSEFDKGFETDFVIFVICKNPECYAEGPYESISLMGETYASEKAIEKWNKAKR